MHQDTVTLFNRKKNKSGDVWLPSILTGVNVNIDRGAIVKVYGETSDDNMILNVPYIVRGPHAYVATDGGEKAWLPPKEWQRSAGSNITFTSGNAFDFVWCGAWHGGAEIPDDYGDRSFYEYMLAMYDYVYAVTSVSMFSVIPHFEIAGK